MLVLRSSNSGTCLKEDLSKCPNKVSEEMVRYMATIYCLLQWTDPSEKAEKMCAPFLSRSSTTALPRRSNGSKDSFSSKRPFEMCSIWSEKYQSSDASSAINNYRYLFEQNFTLIILPFSGFISDLIANLGTYTVILNRVN